MSQETINLLVGALIGIASSLLTLIVGNIFQRKNEERKHKWELEDREYKRRSEIHDKNINEIRDFIENLHELCHKAIMLTGLLQDTTISLREEELVELMSQLDPLYENAAKNILSLTAFNDEKLDSLEKKVLSLINNNDISYLSKMVSEIISEKHPKINKRKLKEVRDKYFEAEDTISLLRKRLNELFIKVLSRLDPSN